MRSRHAPPRSASFRTLFAGTLPLSFAVLLVAAGEAAAQAPENLYRISQRATVSQTLGNARISLDYSRPLVRGRADVFGGVVHWGELWTPGANEATVLEVDEEVLLNGHAVPEGRWSMWIIPSQVGPWELVLDARDTLFHTERPELTDDQIRFVIDTEEAASHAEALMWAFHDIRQDGGVLEMAWGRTRIPIEVEVEPNAPDLSVPLPVAAPYVGDWDVHFMENPETGEAMPATVLTIQHGDDGSLRAGFPPRVFAPPSGSAPDTPAPDPDLTPQERERAEARRLLQEQEAGAFEYVLVPRAHGIFLMGYVDGGDLLEVADVFHEFEFDGDDPVRLTIRGPDDRVFATGTRVGATTSAVP